jgi:hypothetical protein
VVRPTAGAILFAATTQNTIHMSPILAWAAASFWQGVSTPSRPGRGPVLTATTGGTANPIASTIEDIVATVTSFVAIIFPYLILAWMFLLVLLAYLIVRWRRERRESASHI